MRLRTRLLVLLSAVVVVPAATTLIVLYRSMVSTYEDTAAQRLHDSVVQTSQTMDEFVHTRAEDLRVLGLDPMFWKASHQEISAYLAQRVAIFPYYRAFYHVDRDGVIVAASQQEVIGRSLLALLPALSDHFHAATTSAPEALFATDLTNEGVYFLSGVADQTGRTDGVLVGLVGGGFLRHLIADLDARTIGDAHSYGLTSAGGVALTGGNAADHPARHPDFVLEPVRQTIGTKPSGTVVYWNSEGRKVISAFVRLRPVGDHQSSGHLLFSTAVYSDVMAPIRSKFLIASAVIVGVSLLATMVSVAFTTRIGRRLDTLASTARAFERGRFEMVADVTPRDELGDVGRAFNDMAARIAERTAELESLNDALRLENLERTRVEAALRAKEHSLSESQRLGHVGTWFSDMSGPISWSDELYRLNGVTAETFTPSVESFFSLIHPDDRSAMQAWIAACAVGEQPGELEYRVMLSDGTVRFLTGCGESVQDAGGRTLYMAGTVHDVTERKKTERALAERSRLSALAADVGSSLTHGLSLRDMLQGCAGALVQHLDAAFARVWTLNEQTAVLELQASAGMYTHLDGPHARVPVGKFKIGLIAAERLPHLTNQVLNDPRVGDQAWARREGMVAFAGYPLMVDGRVVGVMALFARHSLPDVTLHAMASIADGIALGVERMRTEAALRESEQRTRLQSAALESTANGVVITDVHGTIQWVNRAFTELTGYSAAEAIGENPRLLRSGHHGESFYEALWQTISGGRVWKGELINRRKDGRLYHEEMTITPVRDSGAITHFVAVKQDISERKQTEEERLKFFALIENSADFIGMATLEGKPFYLNAAGRALVGLGRDIEVSATEIADYWEPETAAVLRDVGIPTAFAAGHWSGEGGLRHFTTRDLIPVHVHAFLVRDPRTRQPICLATIVRNISDIKETEQRLAQVNRELRDVSRLSGMAEVATSVLHNVGNVLNSVNVSADRIADKLKRLRPASLERVAGLLREHAHDLPEYLTRDPRGRELPGYLNVLVEQLGEPQRDILPELALLRDNIEHIRQVVRMQQTYARATGVFETMALADLVEDAIRINAASCARHDIQVIREYTPAPPFPIDKHKVLQILVNLLCNAKNALDAAGRRDGTLTVRVGMNAAGMARVSVTDNGVGIAPENLTRVFQHGFTTRKDGHGFGLHSGALAAQELGGSLTAHSEGAGQGAVFTLDLPCPAAEDAA